MPSTTERPLPSRAEVDLADYKIGSVMSDLDSIHTTIQSCAGDTISLQEYRYRQAEGFAFPDAPEYDPDELARLVVFATDVLADVETIREDARAIQEVARHLHHEQAYDDRAQRALVRAWHEGELNEKGGDE
jgi:hypothetical protein